MELERRASYINEQTEGLKLVKSYFQAYIDKTRVQKSLQTALLRQEFQLAYQPRVDMRSNAVLGMEVLLRWPKAPHGMTSPTDFIPNAERFGLMNSLGHWIIYKALHTFSRWFYEIDQSMKLAINLSPTQLTDTNFAGLVSELLEEFHIPAHAVEFELTETSFEIDSLSMEQNLHDLRDLGVELAIDDFGTGHSSLTRLRKLPINTIKIDQSFIHGVPHESEDVSIVEAIIDLSKKLNLKVVAEGIETEKQRQFLIKLGCVEAQGYYFSKPLSAENMTAFLGKER